MTRVFVEGSKPKIDDRIAELFSKLDRVDSQARYDQLHSEFCQCFTKNICTAEKKKKDGTVIKVHWSVIGVRARAPGSFTKSPRIVTDLELSFE
jgi:hypothetical protein